MKDPNIVAFTALQKQVKQLTSERDQLAGERNSARADAEYWLDRHDDVLAFLKEKARVQGFLEKLARKRSECEDAAAVCKRQVEEIVKADLWHGIAGGSYRAGGEYVSKLFTWTDEGWR